MDEPSHAPLAVVVEDNPTTLLHMADLLTDAGFSVLTATGGQHAFDRLEMHEGSIALLIADVMIPGPFDGFALARLAAMVWPEIAIIVTSGEVKPERPSDMPPDAVFITKPFTDADVRVALVKLGVMPNPAAPVAK